MIDEQQVKVQVAIGEIQIEEDTPHQQREQKIEVIRSRAMLPGTDSSLKVVTSLSNTMIGSSIIVYPILFIKDGLIGSLLIMIVIGIVQYLTCRILVVHSRPDEADFNQQIKRILGNRWTKFNSIVNFLLLYFVCIAYFLLICSNFYQITSYLIGLITDFTPPSSTEINFGKYSLQYATLLAMCFTAPFLLRREIEPLLRLFKYTIYCVAFYGIFVLTSLVKEMALGKIDFSQYEFFNPDFSSVAGTFALSFLIHPIAGPILKKNINQANNERDLFLGYSLTAAIYVFVGFFGGLTCASVVQDILDPIKGKQYSTVFDCSTVRDSEWISQVFFHYSKVVQLGVFLQNLSVMPILSFLTRKELIDLMQTPSFKERAFWVYNVSMILFCVLISGLCINVSIVLSLDGAIIGFFMAYGIPIYTHLTCYHHRYTSRQNVVRRDLLLSDESLASTVENVDPQSEKALLGCNQHEPKNKIRHYVTYGGLVVFGLGIGALKLISFFQ